MGREKGSGWGTYVCWTIKNAEHQRMDAFELWCWRRLLRVPCTARRSNQSILKESNPDYSLEGLMLKLKLQYFGHLMQTADSLEKTDDVKDRRQGKKQRRQWHPTPVLLPGESHGWRIILIRSHLFIFAFISNILGGGS